MKEAFIFKSVAGKEVDAVKLQGALNNSAKKAYSQVQQMNGDTKPVNTCDRSSSCYEWQPEKVETIPFTKIDPPVLS